MQCLCGLPDCTDFRGYSKLLICIPSLLVESVQGSGKSLVIYQENSMCFFFLGPSSWNVYAMDQVEANIFQCTSYKSRLVL